MLFCQAVVSESGQVETDKSTYCFGGSPYDDERAQRLRRNVVRSEFEPAKIDGEPVRVYVSFRVAFKEDADRCRVTVLPNFGAQQDQLGLTYLAPQEILTNGGWLGSPGVRSRSWRTHLLDGGVAFTMSVAVDEFGRASDGKVEGNNFAPETSVNVAVHALEMSKFIPAFVDGQPRAARYFEILFLRRP